MRNEDMVEIGVLVSRRLACGSLAVLVVIGADAAPCAAALLTLTPALSVGEQYNDNIFFNQTHDGDYVTRVSPSFGLRYQSPRLTTFLSGSTTATWFARHTSQNNAFDSQSGTVGVSYEASRRLTLTMNDGVMHVHETRTSAGTPTASGPPPPQAEPPGAATDVSTLLPRGEAFSNFVAGSAAYRLTPRWSSTLTYTNAVNDFTNPGGSEMTNRALTSLGYTWSPVLSLNAYYSYSRFNVRTGPDSESHGAGAGAGYRLGQTWWFKGSAGFYVNRPIGSESDSISTQTGPSFDLVLIKQLKRSWVTAGANQVVSTSAGVAGTSVTLTGFVDYAVTLSPKLTASVAPRYSHFDTSSTNFSTLQVPATLTYTFWKYFSATLSYSYTLRESSASVPGVLDQGSVDGNLVQVYLTAAYPVWRGNM